MAFASLTYDCWRADVPPVADVAAAKPLLNSLANASPPMPATHADIASAGHQRGGAQVEGASACSGMLQDSCCCDESI